MPGKHALITLPDGSLDGELDTLVALLDEAGLDAEIRSPDVRMGGVLDTVTTAVIEAPIAYLVPVLMTAAGKRAWTFLTGALGRARRRGQEDGGGDETALVIADCEVNVHVELAWDALDEAALSDLREFLSRLDRPSDDRQAIVIRWNPHLGGWEQN